MERRNNVKCLDEIIFTANEFKKIKYYNSVSTEYIKKNIIQGDFISSDAVPEYIDADDTTIINADDILERIMQVKAYADKIREKAKEKSNGEKQM